jgi:DNA-binding NarL/FixJ family response regulator
MNILLVEDHRLVADAMKIMLKEIEPGVNITACYSTQHALSTIDSGADLDLILSDLFMPGIDGMGLLTGLRNRGVNIPVVIISGADDDKYIRSAIKKGASGYIKKTLPGAEMMAGLRQVLSGGRFFPDRFLSNESHQSTQRPSEKRAISSATSVPTPGEKQLQVLNLMAEGNSNKQISQIIGISEATVKYHTSQLFKLLSVKNRTSCVREAQNCGLLETHFDEPVKHPGVAPLTQ